MTTRKKGELPPAHYPTAQDKVNLFREHGIEAVEVPWWYEDMPRELAVEFKGDQDTLEEAIEMSEKHGLTVMAWSSRHSHRDRRLGIDPTWTVVFNF